MLDMEILRPPIGSRGKVQEKMNNNPQIKVNVQCFLSHFCSADTALRNIALYYAEACFNTVFGNFFGIANGEESVNTAQEDNCSIKSCSDKNAVHIDFFIS